MAENLVIVESPAKAKTIEKYLGKDFKVVSCYGHIRDLSKKNLGIDIQNGFKPNYEVSPDKKNVISELQKNVKTVQTVWLASDEDREGEAIAWHLAEVLNLKQTNTKRIVFHEITENAIKNAIKTPRSIDYNLVNAQQARRILDRLVGFEISPILWKKVKPQLSAGRVQSVAVRLIVEREREIINFETKTFFKITALFYSTVKQLENQIFKAELNKKFNTKEEANDFLNLCKNAQFTIDSVEKKPTKKSPSPPFTTSTLQQEAARKLGFSVSKTMTVAQRLYENGIITYMRTDSTNLSELAINTAKNEIISNYGEKYSKVRKYQTKSKGAQEAHEAIRPTYINRTEAGETLDEHRLYDLIWKRTIACQMSDAEIEKTVITIAISNSKQEKFIAKGEVILFDGFLKVYLESTDDEQDDNEDTLLPPLKNGDTLNYKQIQAIQKFTHYPARYNEASLVRKLEELGIGRPSTYEPTISTIQKRGYVVKEDRTGEERKYKIITLEKNEIKETEKKEQTGVEKSKLFPTDIGMVVNDFLIQNFDDIISYTFTASVEKEFDEIAAGERKWESMIDRFYKSFHPLVEKTEETTERNSGERILGIDHKTGSEISVRIGRFGPMIQQKYPKEDSKPVYASIPKGTLMETITLEEALAILEQSKDGKLLGETPEGNAIYVKNGKYGPFLQIVNHQNEEKNQNVSLPKGITPDNITLEKALSLLQLPRTIGVFENKNVVVNTGRFGPYILHNGIFTPLKKTDDPYTITLERAIELIEAKRDSDEKRIIKLFPEDKTIKVVYDRWKKPAIQYKRQFFKISKEKKPEELTLQECLEIVGAVKTKSSKK
ncbi:MAG: type I DNA topoisomerase [Bacteroidales bacterium]